jgi:hypothetical protein
MIVRDGISRGKTYRFRYRVSNINGWSLWSDVAYISAFSIPSAPPAPLFKEATSTTVTLTLLDSDDDNGVPISEYELWLDAGNNLLSTFHLVPGYDGVSSEYELLSTDGLSTAGTKFRAKYRAKNIDGQYSDYSNELLFA